MKTSLFAGILVAALAAPAAADRAEDDLQLVKKAVGSSPVAQARPAGRGAAPPRAEAAPPPRKGAAARGSACASSRRRTSTRRSRSTCPLGLVRALGDEWPIAERGRCRQDRHCPTLGEVLRALDSGQSLVEIEDDEATVRVWVE